MPTASLSTIKNWFRTGLKPTQAQFWDTWDSFFHKDSAIPSSSVDGLDTFIAASTPIAISVSGSGTYVVPANRLLDVIVWQSSGALKVGTTIGGDDVVDHAASAPGGVFRVDFYRFSSTTIYFTGTGTIKIYVR